MIRIRISADALNEGYWFLVQARVDSRGPLQFTVPLRTSDRPLRKVVPMKARILPIMPALPAPPAADEGDPNPCFAGTDVLKKKAG